MRAFGTKQSPYLKTGKKYTICYDCGRILQHWHEKTQKLVRAASQYPYCFPCLFKRIHDPGFKEWLIKKANTGKL